MNMVRNKGSTVKSSRGGLEEWILREIQAVRSENLIQVFQSGPNNGK